MTDDNATETTPQPSVLMQFMSLHAQAAREGRVLDYPTIQQWFVRVMDERVAELRAARRKGMVDALAEVAAGALTVELARANGEASS